MKLFEINSSANKIGHVPVVYVNKLPDLRNGKLMGAGMQADVYQFPNHPGTVIKSARIDTTDDAYLKFINICLSTDNIYFPKIYNAKLLIQKDSNEMLLVTNMEKLHKWDPYLSTNKLKDAIDHYFKTRNVIDNDHDRIGSFFIYLFDDIDTVEDVIKTTNDDQLKEALSILYRLFIDTEKYSDLHSGNIMVRLTPYGPQMVFTDPVMSL